WARQAAPRLTSARRKKGRSSLQEGDAIPVSARQGGGCLSSCATQRRCVAVLDQPPTSCLQYSGLAESNLSCAHSVAATYLLELCPAAGPQVSNGAGESLPSRSGSAAGTVPLWEGSPGRERIAPRRVRNRDGPGSSQKSGR